MLICWVAGFTIGIVLGLVLGTHRAAASIRRMVNEMRDFGFEEARAVANDIAMLIETHSDLPHTRIATAIRNTYGAKWRSVGKPGLRLVSGRVMRRKDARQ